MFPTTSEYAFWASDCCGCVADVVGPCELVIEGLPVAPEVGFVATPKGDGAAVPVGANGDVPTLLPPKGDPPTLPLVLPNSAGVVPLPPPNGEGVPFVLVEPELPNGDGEVPTPPPKGEGEAPKRGEELPD